MNLAQRALTATFVLIWCVVPCSDLHAQQSVPIRQRSKLEEPRTPAQNALAALPATVSIKGMRPDGTVVTGSGFVVDSSGTVVTNFHVIRSVSQAVVQLQTGETYERISVRAYDDQKDIAILQIPGFGIPTLPLGDSNNVHVGDPVILVGSPLGLNGTVSSGIISADRTVKGLRYLQTDAAASHGNSGGPALDSTGKVIGILTAGLEEGQNLNFLVPINYARGMLSLNDNLDLATVANKFPLNRQPEPVHETKSPAPSPHAEKDTTPTLSAAGGVPYALGPAATGTSETHALVYVYRSSGLYGRAWDPPVTVDDVLLV